MLGGGYGPAVELAMKAIVKVGDTVKAEKLIPIASSHTGNAGLLSTWGSYVGVLKQLAEYGAKVNVPTSENPYPYDIRTPLGPSEEFEIPEPFKKSGQLEGYYRTLGIMPTWTCTPYQYGNIPRFGQHISWEESSAVVFVNAVLGAKTNRESILMDVLTAIAGRTPYHGLHINENRRGETLCVIQKNKLTSADYQAIGYYVGRTVGNKIPVLDGMPRDISVSDLKNFGSTAAASGAVAHFHVPGVTPEARSLEDAFGGEKPTDKIEIGLREIKETSEEMSAIQEGEKIDVVAVGCPHYYIEEIQAIAKMLNGKKVNKNVQFWVFAHDTSRTLAQKLGYANVIEASGARLVTGCPLLLSKYPHYDKMRIMSDSGRMCYYVDLIAYGSLEDCVKSAVEGKVVRS